MTAIRNMRAKAFSALALLFCVPALAQAPVDYDEDATAVYLARVVSMEFAGDMPCPPEYICMSSLYYLTLEPVEPIANSPDIGTRTFRVVQHARYIDGHVLLAVAQRDKDGNWHLVDRTSMERRACFSDPRGDVSDNFEDERGDWYAEFDENNRETCIYGPDIAAMLGDAQRQQTARIDE